MRTAVRTANVQTIFIVPFGRVRLNSASAAWGKAACILFGIVLLYRHGWIYSCKFQSNCYNLFYDIMMQRRDKNRRRTPEAWVQKEIYIRFIIKIERWRFDGSTALCARNAQITRYDDTTWSWWAPGTGHCKTRIHGRNLSQSIALQRISIWFIYSFLLVRTFLLKIFTCILVFYLICTNFTGPKGNATLSVRNTGRFPRVQIILKQSEQIGK